MTNGQRAALLSRDRVTGSFDPEERGADCGCPRVQRGKTMTANPDRAPLPATERRAWTGPKLTRFAAGTAEFGGGPALDGDSSPS